MAELTQVLRHVTPVEDPNALVGHATGDDATVYRVAEDRAIVVTADFFTPIVDDPYDFGRIAAVNALSDIFAMGAKPLFALNLVCFPRKLLPEGILDEIVRGGSDAAREAGIPILGGHSIDDAEPKFGMVVVGEVHPARMITNAGAREGDALVLTKPIGSGVIATAIKEGEAPVEVIEEAVRIMATPNRAAAEAAAAEGIVAGTDVTGFGLLGHLHRMLAASGVSATVEASAVPLMPGARQMAAAGHIPGGSRRNLEDVESVVSFADTVDPVTRTLLADAQTSGGLLLAVPADPLESLLERMSGQTPAVAVIGTITAGVAGSIAVR